MKKLLLTLVAGAAALTFTASAQAGQFAQVYVGSDRCGHPVYNYVPKAALYGYNCADEYRPRCVPAPVCRETYYGYRAPVRCHRDTRPRISFSFGF